jgi:hypothetical protein
MPGKTDDSPSDQTGSPGGASLRLFSATRIQHPMIQSFLVSTSVVGLAEIGDKTQLLSLVLAARYRKPIPIIPGVDGIPMKTPFSTLEFDFVLNRSS